MIESKLSPKDESGVILILTAIFITAIVLFVVFSISINEWSQTSTSYRSASNAAAVSAASTLCSTRQCYNQSLINALLSIQKLQIRGLGSPGSFADGIQAAITALQAQLTNGISYISSPSGNTEWTIDGVRIRVQRGRYWNRGYTGQADCVVGSADGLLANSLIPPSPQFTNVSATLVEPKFEPFDRFDGVNWQTCDTTKGTPNFLAANAVRVTIDVPNFKSSLHWTGLPVATLFVDTVSARNKNDPDQHKFCGAPFAIPACALVNPTGEYQPSEACQLDRFFTDIHRYCTQSELDNGTCNVLPGSWYGVVTPGACDLNAPWGSNQKCECYQASQTDVSYPPIPSLSFPPVWLQGHADVVPGSVGGIMSYNAPCSQELGQGSQECTFFPWPKSTEVADHFGVVGTSIQGIASFPFTGRDKTLEDTYRTIIQMANSCTELNYTDPSNYTIKWFDGAVPTAIGDDYYIKPGGLTEAATDQPMWQRIYGRNIGNDPLRQYPRFWEPQNFALNGGRSGIITIFGDKGFRELGFPWFMGRVDDAHGYPYGETKALLDGIKDYAQQLDPPHLLDDYETVTPYECLQQNIVDHGTCNSHRTWYNNRCARSNRRWQTPPTDGSQFQLRTVEEFVQNDASGYPAEFAYDDPNVSNFSCSEIPPYMPCNVPSVGGPYPEGGELAPPAFYNKLPDYPAWQIPIWHTSIPVIADTSPDAIACNGVAGSTRDAPIDPTHPWKVIGFVRAYFFDNDIGKAPPMPPGPTYGSPEPQVCNYAADTDGNGIPDRYPWQFNPTYVPPSLDPTGKPSGPPQNWGAPANCNMVRAHIACENGLISGDYHGLPNEKKTPPSIVYLN
ncbi:MAG: hypothetical protein U0136_03875 [Bdellovibrionota bacterium]